VLDGITFHSGGFDKNEEYFLNLNVNIVNLIYETEKCTRGVF